MREVAKAFPMIFEITSLNWLGIGAAVLVGQLVSTFWFVGLFGKPWAEEYGVADAKEHTKALPPYTYAAGLVCTISLAVSLAVLQGSMGVQTTSSALVLALFVSVGFCLSTLLPGQAFLRRWRTAAIAGGSQVAMIVAMSLTLVLVG